MEFAKGIATGFTVGVAAIGIAVALLYGHDDSMHERNAERIAKLETQVQQLEHAVNRLAGRVADIAPVDRVPETTAANLTSVTAIPRGTDAVP